MLAFDTNLLFYAVNQDSPFHRAARSFFDSVQKDSRVVISELMLVELYCLLRNPTINRAPLQARPAAEVIEAYRRHPQWRLVGFPPEGRRVHDQLWRAAARSGFAYRRIYDARMAFSLIAQGVRDFATANVKDFEGMGFHRVWNPLEEG